MHILQGPHNLKDPQKYIKEEYNQELLGTGFFQANLKKMSLILIFVQYT